MKRMEQAMRRLEEAVARMEAAARRGDRRQTAPALGLEPVTARLDQMIGRLDRVLEG
jgi:hypothetical protein